MSTSVVLKMLGRNLGITTLHNKLYGIWKLFKPFQLMDIENGYFLAKFQSTNDYDKILSQGPWVIFGYYLTIQPWRIDFNPSLPYPNLVLTWIRFPDLPSHLYQKQILIEIRGMCGCYRHSKENYPVVINSSVTEEKGEKSEQTIATSEVAEDGESGPWMLVELRSRRGTLDGNKKGNNLKGEKFLGSR
ncbi:hypothetical protein PVK06_040470 [Gossypium arboreum]|uniref:DUF4283 domain-containing protein n=1 Tax=Gossypium arboreum TaxID=29729 RepID=A0ABR0N8B8_GOSAR|nr:hypothetical protein PVK06_040470 [Gossypium arboreum]